MASAVNASFEFLQWQESYEKQKPYEIFLPLDSFGEQHRNKVPRSNLVFEPRTVSVQDVRGREGDFGLDTHGFQFVRHSTGVIADLKDRRAVSERYVPEMMGVLRECLAGTVDEASVRTLCFDLRVSPAVLAFLSTPFPCLQVLFGSPFLTLPK